MWSQELGSVIFMGPFQLEIFYDSMTSLTGLHDVFLELEM